MEDDLYAILNVPQDVSPQELRQAYRKLCLTYHPDRHTDPAAKEQANAAFARIQRAYQVLNDPHQRRVYDTCGVDGLDMQLGPHLKTAEQIKRAFEEQARRQAGGRRGPDDQVVKGNLEFAFDASQCLARRQTIELLREQYGEDHPPPPPLVAFQSTRVKVENTQYLPSQFGRLTYGCLLNAVALGGGVSGITNLEWHNDYKLTKFSAEALIPLALVTPEDPSKQQSTPVMSLGAERRLSHSTAGGVKWILAPPPPRHPKIPIVGLELSVDHEINSKIKSGIKYNLSQAPGVTLFSHVKFSEEESSKTMAVNFSLPLNLQAHYNQPLGKVHLAAQGPTISVGCGRSVKSTIFNVSVAGGLSGVSLKIQVARWSQHLVFPIMLCHGWDTAVFLGAAAIPTVISLLLRRLVYRPWKEKAKRLKLQEEREANAEFIAAAKAEAEAAIQLMENTVTRQRAEEMQKNGLVIVRATYGNVSPQSRSREFAVEVDVTFPVQHLVEDSALYLQQGHSRSGLLGFYDPCPGEAKYLYVRYSFKGKMHEGTFDDSETILLPMQEHLMP